MGNQSLMAMMDTLLKQASQAEKRASGLSNTSGPEPTSHPVMSADPGTKPATEGARSAENEADVKEEFGNDLATTGQEDAESAANRDKDEADSIGTQSSAADEMRGNVQQPKATKDAPADSGPGDETFNEKYSAARVVEAGNRLLALLSKEAGLQKGAEDEECEEEEGAEEEAKEEEAEEKTAFLKKASDTEKRAAAETYPEDAEAGYVAAQMIAENLFNKQAEEEKAAALAEQIIKAAHADAEMVCEFLNSHEKGTKAMQALKAASMNKRSMLEAGLPAMGGSGEIPTEGAMIPPEGAMIPPEALAAGAAEMPEAGGAGGDVGAGGGDDEATIEALAEALAEAGVTPEELAQTIAEAGGSEGAPDEAAGAMPVAEAGGEGAGGEVAEEAPKAASLKRIRAIKQALLNLAK